MRYQEILEFSKSRRNQEQKLKRSREKLQATIWQAMEPDDKLGFTNKMPKIYEADTEDYEESPPLGYWDSNTKKFYGSWEDGHLGAGLVMYKSGDFPILNNIVNQEIAEYGDEEDEGGLMDIISNYIPKHLVRIGNFDSDGFIIQADETYAKLAARYFLKDILKNEWPVYIDTDKDSFSWEMPMDRQKLTTWLSS